MFFRRVFSRKESSISANGGRIANDDEIVPISPSHRLLQRKTSFDEKRGLTVLQLTPLWEHIIRTKALPLNINEVDMFGEFLERLYDPEWQVRQHALRVLVDVLIVMGQRADQHFAPLVKPLVENLGHAAPAIRKGALDALKVYMSETAMPETILLEVLDVGLEQRGIDESLFGRLCVGVMLSLPSLIQTTMHTSKRSFILKSTIGALTTKMIQVTYQEVALKVLLKIRESIGSREFSEYIDHAAYREFELLCNVYGLTRLSSNRVIGKQVRNGDLYVPSSSRVESNRKWRNSRQKPTELYWRSTDDDTDDVGDSNNAIEQFEHRTSNSRSSGIIQQIHHENMEDEKVIMETEINIENTSLTMRILEESNCHEVVSTTDSDEDEDIKLVYEHSGIVRVLTDSEVEDNNNSHNNIPTNIETDEIRRTPRRVTFGGEIVKMRTPDSDSLTQSDADDIVTSNNKKSKNNTFNNENVKKELKIDIPINQTVVPQENITSKRPASANVHRLRPNGNNEDTLQQLSKSPKCDDEIKENSPKTKRKLSSKKFRRLSISPVDDIISPKIPHKEIEVLHNLQRSPSISPTRNRSNSNDNLVVNDLRVSEKEKASAEAKPSESSEMIKNIKSWEELGLIDDYVLQKLKSGDWRHRSDAICHIENALKSSENLAIVQPYLDTLFRMLLSSEKNFDVMEDKRRVIVNLISRLPLDNLENRAGQIIIGLCRQGGAGSNKVAKALMQRLPPTAVVHRLMSDDFVKARSSKFRENALQMVLYALMTFPSTYFDIQVCVRRAVYAVLDRKRRVRQASLDVLAVLGQISSIKTVMDIVHEIAENRDDCEQLCAAAKARLSRKQLPIVSSDGNVQYALRIPSPESNGSGGGSNSNAICIFGSDVEWIMAGIGSVSPTSLRKRSLKMQQIQNYYSSNNNNNNNNGNIAPPLSDDPNRHPNDAPKKQKAPHEILAVGVGVKSANEYNNQNNYGSFTKIPTYNMDEYKTTQYIVATAAIQSTQNPMHLYNNGGIKQMKQQSRSFPELFESTNNKQPILRNFMENGNKPSKLPINTRFPAMESNADGKNGKSADIIYYGKTNLTRNGSLPRNLNSVKNQDFKDTMTGQSSSEDIRNLAISALDQNVDNSRRFANVNRHLLAVTRIVNNNQKPNRQDDQIQRPLSVNDHRPSSTNHSIGNASISSQVDQQSIHTNNATPSEHSSVERTNSITSTSTRVLDEIDYNIAVNSNEDNVSQRTSLPSESRPLSETSDTKDVANDDNRPKTAMSINTIGTTFSEPISVGESKAILQHVDSFQEIDEKSITPISLRKINTPEPLPLDDTVSDVGSVLSLALGSSSQSTNNSPTKQSVKSVNLITTELPDQQNDSQNVPEPDAQSITTINTEDDTNSSDYASNNQQCVIETRDEEELCDDIINDDETKIIPEPIIINNVPLQISPKKMTKFLPRSRKISPTKAAAPLVHQTKQQKQIDICERKFDKPKEALNGCFHQLDSTNWEQTMTGLQTFVRLLRHHSELIEPHIHTFSMALCKHIKNLRSQVSRTACLAAGDFFHIHGKLLEQEAEDLSLSLLNRTADTNKFLRSDATKALEIMCDNLPISKVIQIITTRGATHQNAIVRSASAKLCNRIVERIGCDKVYLLNRDIRDKIILTGANMMMEGSLETRNYAKLLFRQLSGHPNYTKLLLDIIPPKTYRNIEKTLRSIK